MARRTQFQIWKDTFKPIKNDIDENASGDGCMFETFGAELDKVVAANKADPGKVWTLLDVDGDLYIGQGYHHVNRMGYFITEVAYDPANPDHVKRYGRKDVKY